MGPVYRYAPNLDSEVKLPEYYDNTLFVYEWSRHWLMEVKLDEDGDLLKINPFLPGVEFIRPMEMEVGPDGAIYILEWGTQFWGSNDDAKLVRIEYTKLPLSTGIAGAGEVAIELPGCIGSVSICGLNHFVHIINVILVLTVLE